MYFTSLLNRSLFLVMYSRHSFNRLDGATFRNKTYNTKTNAYILEVQDNI